MLPDELIRGEHTVSQRKFNEQQRIDKALEWLTDPKEAVNFVAVYFPEPDEVGHKCGPDSQEVQQAILDLDKALGYLMDQVEKNGLSGKLNIIVTADHGQLRTYPHPTAEINIDRLVDRDWYRIEPNLRNGVAMANIWPKEGFQDKLLERLRHHNLHVCVKNSSQDLRDLHYSSSCRIGPVVVYAEEGWLIVDDSSDRRSVGEHGWDPRYSINMYPFFIATGPAFKKGVRDAAPFRMVDIYPMMCHILGLEPAPNNGTLENVRHILATE
nr:hypothetical protein BaRGS_009334 [Batillaria attramentaria]